MSGERGFLDSALDFIGGAVDGLETMTGGARVTEAKAGPPDASRAQRWKITEAIDQGVDVWIVTNSEESATCTSQALAERVLEALSK